MHELTLISHNCFDIPERIREIDNCLLNSSHIKCCIVQIFFVRIQPSVVCSCKPINIICAENCSQTCKLKTFRVLNCDVISCRYSRNLLVNFDNFCNSVHINNSGNNYAQYKVELKNLYGSIEISDKAIRASQSNVGAFVNLLNAEMEGLLKASKYNLCTSNKVYGRTCCLVNIVNCILNSSHIKCCIVQIFFVRIQPSVVCDFKMHQLCDWRWLEGDNGNVIKQKLGNPTYTATLVKYADIVCDRPCGQAKLSGIKCD